jgi:hypothetical protein
MTHRHYIKEKNQSQATDVTPMAKLSETDKEFATAARFGSPSSGTPNQRLVTWGSAPSAETAKTKKLAFDTRKKTFFLDAKKRKVPTTGKEGKGSEQKAS